MHYIESMIVDRRYQEHLFMLSLLHTSCHLLVSVRAIVYVVTLTYIQLSSVIVRQEI